MSTRFIVAEGGEVLVDFMNSVARHLGDMPMDRLEHERRILQVEASHRSGGQVGADLSARYGPTGAGLLGWPEHGLVSLDGDDVHRWTHTWFTAENAVLWVTGPVPPGLSLAQLPRGDPPARVAPPASMPPQRSFVGTETSVVSISVVGDDADRGLSMGMDIAWRRAFDQLRRQDGLSYQVEASRTDIAPGVALEYLGSDAAEGAQAQVLKALIDVFDELAETGPTTEEVTAQQRNRRHSHAHPEASVGYLNWAAERRVMGLPLLARHEVEARVHSLTTEQIHADLAASQSTILAVGPQEIAGDLDGWCVYDLRSSDDFIVGKEYQPLAGREEGTLVVGSDGLSWGLDDLQRFTVSWEDAVASCTWDNGVRRVVGPTGSVVIVVPWCWRGGAELTRLVDDSIDPGRRVRMGEGTTTYLDDPADPESVAHVTWLGSLVGARDGDEFVDLVVSTDGVLVLSSQTTSASQAQRLKELQSCDWATLMERNPRSRWIPECAIVYAQVKRRRFVGMLNIVATLIITQPDGKGFKFGLRSAEDAEFIRQGMAHLLGPRFVES